MDPKDSISSSKSSSLPSHTVAGENLVDELEQPIGLIVVESGPLSSLPDLQFPSPKGQENAAIFTPTDESISCNPFINDGDDEDEEESESVDANVIIADYIAPLKNVAG